MKKGFSLLELVFAIVILGVIASFAIPKYLDTKDSALVSTIKRDINTAINSIQSYYLLNQKIEKITDCMSVNESNWTVSDLKLVDKNSCVTIEVKTTTSGSKTLDLTVDDKNVSNICKKIKESGIITKSYEL